MFRGIVVSLLFLFDGRPNPIRGGQGGGRSTTLTASGSLRRPSKRKGPLREAGNGVE